MNYIHNFDFGISSLDEITHDIDDDIIEAILEETGVGDDKLDHAFDRFNDTFLDALKEKNNKDSRHSGVKRKESMIFDTKREYVISVDKDHGSMNTSFDPLIVEPFSVKGSFALTKEQQIDKINQYSKNLLPTFLELKNSSKKKEKKEPPMPFPTSSRYRDFSNVADEEVRLNFNNMVGRTQETFPVKLHKIIDQIERDGLSSIISWCPHGRAFKIYNNTLFIKVVISRYFYQTKMSSFTRQLGA